MVQAVTYRVEYLCAAEVKAILVGLQVTGFLCLSLLLASLVVKLVLQDNSLAAVQPCIILNLVAGSICFATLLIGLQQQAAGVVHAFKSKRHWSQLRARQLRLRVTEAFVQLVNLGCYLLQNSIALTKDRPWESKVIQWSTFGSLSYAAISDAPCWFHLADLIPWIFMEVIVVCFAYFAGGAFDELRQTQNSPDRQGTVTSLPGGTDSCPLPMVVLICGVLLTAAVLAHCAIFLVYLHRGMHLIQSLDFRDYRITYFKIRHSRRVRCLTFFLVIASLVLFLLVRPSSCTGYVEVWCGLLAPHVSNTSHNIVACYFYTPKDPTSEDVMQVALQTFVWMTQDEEASNAVRLQKNISRDEPHFCFETCLKLLVWAHLSYARLPCSPASLSLMALAMEQFHSEDFRQVVEAATSVQAIMGWNSTILVVAFRGSCSTSNFISDAEAWQVRYPQDQGPWRSSPHCAVHHGFLSLWTENGFNQNLLARVGAILDSCRDISQVYFTGHSLGGALATLAAFELQQMLQGSRVVQLACYTFGAPRTGNHAFANEYGRRIPQTWHIINDQDAVARMGKFLMLYKRPGLRVLVNLAGQMIVRPSFMELSIQQACCSSSINDHLLGRYRASLSSVVEAALGRQEEGCSILNMLHICNNSLQ
ncbi:hypothetical protein WJX74_011070 [Apatococcus lobatus]|uniref:Fungal lipase-type domain-containing protein n=1 Tax=Apatococcus lobatus TaxID=904363 RepID=A0AAW1PUW7_9CHLO